LGRLCFLTAIVAACSEFSLNEAPLSPDPTIAVEPARLDFGVVEVGATADLPFTITNVGGAELQIGQTSIDHPAFSVDVPAFVALQPGEALQAVVTYDPRSERDAAVAMVENTDPDTPLAEVELLGAMSGERPVAVCSVDPPEILALREEATWVGRDSHDPNGSDLTYAWTLITKPAGSSATMPPDWDVEPDREGFVADLVGKYVAQLVVTNADGVASEPCAATLDAVPASDLWVEMFWEKAEDDMDLHLVRGNGRLESDDDCFFDNCKVFGLPWPPSGRPGNPVLDIDDIDGTGPENINIDQPDDTLYHVWVHDYPLWRKNADNEVTVRIYLSGIEVFDETRVIRGEEHYEHFATVDWAAQTVQAR